MAAWKSVSRRKRSRLGPTRYQPRCKCLAPLPIGEHVGFCQECRDVFLATWHAQGELMRDMPTIEAFVADKLAEAK